MNVHLTLKGHSCDVDVEAFFIKVLIYLQMQVNFGKSQVTFQLRTERDQSVWQRFAEEESEMLEKHFTIQYETPLSAE